MAEDGDLERLVSEVAAHCLALRLLEPGERVLVAASGGADSTALALVLAEAPACGLPLELVLGHVRHGWRSPQEEGRDVDVLQALADRLGAALRVAAPPPRPVASEDAARRWRYGRLAALALEAGARKVATGHHLRDQAETVLLRLLRASGPVGLRGIPARRSLGESGLEVVRPLLEVDPRRLRALLLQRGIPWREDPTNVDLGRDRARVRSRLLALEARGSSTSRDLARLAARFGARLAWRAQQLDRLLGGRLVHHLHAGAVEAPRTVLGGLGPLLLELALRRMGEALGAEREGPWLVRRHVHLAAGLLTLGGALDLPRGLRLVVRGKRAWLHRRHGPPRAWPRIVREDVPAARFDLAAFVASGPRGRAALDADRLGAGVRVRALRPGDTFTPLGSGSQDPVEVEAFLRRQGVPRRFREGWPVVEGERGIAWVPGQRVDRAHAVGGQTRRVALLGLAWEAGMEGGEAGERAEGGRGEEGDRGAGPGSAR